MEERVLELTTVKLFVVLHLSNSSRHIGHTFPLSNSGIFFHISVHMSNHLYIYRHSAFEMRLGRGGGGGCILTISQEHYDFAIVKLHSMYSVHKTFSIYYYLLPL